MSEFNYLKEKRRYLDSIGRTGHTCSGISCCTCMFQDGARATNNSCDDFEIFYPEKATEMVRKWAEEHPLISNVDKFIKIVKDTFGITLDKEELLKECPLGHVFEVIPVCPDNKSNCAECTKWWNEEYKGPKK